MANLDSRSKRASSVGLLTHWLLSPVLPDGTLGQGDRQHSAGMYSGILAAAGTVVAFVFDLNTRLRTYLEGVYAATAPQDLTTLMRRDLNGRTGDMNLRLRALIDDATP